VKVTEMKAHVRKLLRDNQITDLVLAPFAFKGLAGFSCKESREVILPQIRGRRSYLVCLHEVGHVLGPWQERSEMEMEAGAWKWAMENHHDWGRIEDLTMFRGTLSYLNAAIQEELDGRKRRRAIPHRDHFFWKCVPEHALSATEAILKRKLQKVTPALRRGRGIVVA
jgi:hypothetical protein